MLLREDLRKCIAFIGTPGPKENGGITCCATGFFIGYGGSRYLVTAQHVAVGLGDDPYLIRLNKTDGTADNITVDPLTDNVRWFVNEADPDVDLAVMPFNYALREAGYECLFLNGPDFIREMNPQISPPGIGDFCYTLGLFQLVAGKKQNLPVVHRGSLAMIANEERIPVWDWLAPPGSGKVRQVQCHLVETQSLQGLSGAPVFGRASFDIEGFPVSGSEEKMTIRTAELGVSLLGIWQGSWDAPPGSILGVQEHGSFRVPVGMGVVVPTKKLIELLETEPVVNQREDHKRKFANAATLDSAFPEKSVPPAIGANPTHREDFMRLVGAAARKPPQEG
ncbi:hypothetical protein V4R08_05905 [Nitrobacter sp. NHB1]|uniref:hypothetical protein n=1 Tax=Nitrobacter sp. NHB1 TaxID=3119830 RepID=UPI002FFE7CA0